jgi:hypothetical protein
MSADALFEGFEPEAKAEPAPAPKATERTVLDALRRRYTHRAGNGERYILAEHVRDNGTFARRTADLMIRDMWVSAGMPLHGFEVKVSRSDWLTELRDPTKAECFRRHCDYWWLAVSDASIVKDDLPEGWGLIVLSGQTMRIKTKAPRLKPAPMDSAMRVSLDRSIAKTARRHLVLDLEQGAQPRCERYVPSWDCMKAKDSTLCWGCRSGHRDRRRLMTRASGWCLDGRCSSCAFPGCTHACHRTAELVAQTFDEGALLPAISGRIGHRNNGPIETVERLTGPDPLTELAESRMT